MTTQLLSRTQKKKASSKWLSLSKKIGILFIVIVASGVTILVYNSGKSNNCVDQKCSKSIDVVLHEHKETPEREKNTTEYVEDEEQLSDQEEENERLVIQRDIGKSISRKFEKPFNYREGFNCLLKVSNGDVTIENCEDNAVYKRAANLALQKSQVEKITPERIKEDFYLNVRL